MKTGWVTPFQITRWHAPMMCTAWVCSLIVHSGRSGLLHAKTGAGTRDFPGFSTAHPDLSTGASKHTFLVFIPLSSGPRCVLGALRLDIHLWSDSFFLHPPPPPQEDIYTKTEGFCRSPLPWAVFFNYAADETCWNLKHACASNSPLQRPRLWLPGGNQSVGAGGLSLPDHWAKLS